MTNKELFGVLFDFNGVMVDDYLIQKTAWNTIARKIRGVDVTDEEMLNHIRGIPTIQTVKRMAEERAFTEEKLQGFVWEKDGIVQSLFQDSPLIQLSNGLTNFLDSLKEAQIPMTIVSSSRLQNLETIFKRFNLFLWFDLERIVHKDTILKGHSIRNKPAPDPYLAGLNIIQVEPLRCFVFEDAKTGINSAQSAGIEKIIAVNTNPEHLLSLSVIPGVIKSIQDFTQIDIDFLVQSLAN